jgi:hypothetical protein
VSHCSDVDNWGPIKAGVTELLCEVSTNWFVPGALAGLPEQLARIGWHNDHSPAVLLSDGIASAPWMSMCPVAVPFVMVRAALVVQSPLGKARYAPVGFDALSMQVSKVMDDEDTVIDRTPMLIVAVTGPLVPAPAG